MEKCVNCSLFAGHDDPKPFAFALLVVGIVCALLNGLILLILLSKKNLRQNPYKFLVLLLSFSDILVGIGFFIYSLRILIQSWTSSQILCILQITSQINGMYLSLFQTFLISVQRYLVICRTEWSNRLFQNNRKYFVCVLCWMVILVFSVGLISPPEENLRDLHNKCSVTYVYSRHYAVFSAFINFGIMLLVLTILLYCITIRYVIKVNRQIVPEQSVEKDGQRTCRLPTGRVTNRQNTATNFPQMRIAWSRQDEDVSKTQPISTIFLPSDSETQPQIITQHEQSQIITQHERPQIIAQQEQPHIVTQHEQPQIIAQQEQPQIITQHEQPQIITQHEQPQIITQHSQIAFLRRKKITNTVMLVGMLLTLFIFLSCPVTLCFNLPGIPTI
jgi:hypothetical protein